MTRITPASTGLKGVRSRYRKHFGHDTETPETVAVLFYHGGVDDLAVLKASVVAISTMNVAPATVKAAHANDRDMNAPYENALSSP